MPGFESALLLIVLAVGWLFWDGLKARDAGVTAARKVCSAEDFQFLDDTVALNGMRLLRDDEGRLRIQRTYVFEYSETGNNRRPGSVTLLGHDVTMLYTSPRTETDSSLLH